MVMNGISDEQLAAFLEGKLSENEKTEVDRAMDVDMLEVLGVARRALKQGRLPSLDEMDRSELLHSVRKPLAMAGFLGDTGCGDDLFSEDGTDEPSGC